MNLDKLFGPFPILETERLRLREPVREDAGALFEVFGDPEAMLYYGPNVPSKTPEDTAAIIDELLHYYSIRQSVRWAITLEGGNDRAIGTLGFFKFEAEHEVCELGYELHRSYWRQGIMSEALRRILEFGFHEAGLRRVQAGTDGGNPASQALLKKLGFRHEGCFRQRLFYKGRYWDEDWFGLLRDEFDPR